MLQVRSSSYNDTLLSQNPAVSENSSRSQEYVTRVFAKAGIEINGSRPVDIRVYNENFYQRVLLGGSLALGESYTEAWWDCQDLSEMFSLLLKAELDTEVQPLQYFWNWAKAQIFNLQSPLRVHSGGGALHYNLGNEFYAAMLDPEMLYTCGYWQKAKDLPSAQEAKLKLICDKLGLKPGMTLLDIGCGWGGFLRYAVKNYGVKGSGITISEEQAKYAKLSVHDLDIDIQIRDYRDLNLKYDRVASIGMFEHVGFKNYRQFMQVVARSLQPDGLALLHTIGGNQSEVNSDPWIDKYIFPDGMIPSIAQIGKSIEGLFVMEDWHNFGSDYDRTLMAWFHNFHQNWHHFNNKLDYQFYRKWKYFLMASAGSFRSRKNQIWQIVLSPHGTPGGYHRLC